MKTKSRIKMRVSLCISLALLAAFVGMHGVVRAQVAMPTYDYLTPLQYGINIPSEIKPYDVAVDRQGRVYMVESTKNRVVVYSQGGNLLATLTANGLQNPISVAVASTGKVYVGSRDNGNVSVFNPDFSFDKYLAGFGKPMDIAVDSTGRVYVADRTQNAVKFFNADGTSAGAIDTEGNGDGQLFHPIAVAVDEAAGEIVVLDQQQIEDSRTGAMVDGVRIQYFDMSGNLVAGKVYGADRTPHMKFGYNNAGTGVVWEKDENGNFVLDEYGNRIYLGLETLYDLSMGQLSRPKDIHVDESSRLYVTDGNLNNIMVFDNFDNWLGSIDNIDNTTPLRGPIGMTMAVSGKLYVSAKGNESVAAYGVGNFTSLTVTPSSLGFTAIENGSAPSSDQVTIANTGLANISWNSKIFYNSPAVNAWLSLDKTFGTDLLPENKDTFNISVDPQGLKPGKYEAIVTIETGVESQFISVYLKILPNPIQVSPSTLDFKATVGTTAPGQALSVTSANKDQLNLINPIKIQLPPGVSWDVTADSKWISLDKSFGTTPDKVRVYVDTSMLELGTYNGIVTFTNKVGDPAPVEIPVSLTLGESTDIPTDPTDPGYGVKVKWNKKWSISQLLPGKVPGTGTALNGVHGTSSTDVVAVGENGTILNFDGKKWAQEVSGTTTTLNSVLLSRYAVGAEGLVLYKGPGWQEYDEYGYGYKGDVTFQDMWGTLNMKVINDSNNQVEAPIYSMMLTVDEFGTVYDQSFSGGVNLGKALRSIHGNSKNNVYAVGEAGAVFHFDGISWAPIATPETDEFKEWLNGVWTDAEGNNVYAVGENGAIVHYDGKKVWTAMTSNTSVNLNGVCGFAGGDVFAVGDESNILHYNGSEWSSMSFDAAIDLNDIWCTDTGEIIAVGDDGTIVYASLKKFPWNRFVLTLIENGKKAKEANDQEVK